MTPLHALKEIMLEYEAAYMKPMLEYDQQNPVPRFIPNRCSPGGDHIDAFFCCSLKKMSEYIDWFEKTQAPFGFKPDDFNCFASDDWPHMNLSKRYQVSDQEMSCSDNSCTNCTIL